MTTIKVKRSSSQGVSPGTTDLELGELAVNTYDGKLFLKKNDGSDSIVEFNSITKDSNNVFSINPGNLSVTNGTNNQVYLGASDGAIEITRAAGGAYIDFKNSIAEDNDVRIREQSGGLNITGSTYIDGVAIIGGTSVSGGEGGEIRLTKPPTTNIAGDLTFDIQTNSVRFFEAGGNFRGAYIDITDCGNSVGSEIWHSGNDGSGSGLDADLLDGQQGSYYQPASTALTTSTTFGGDVSGTYNAIVVANDSHTHDGRYFTETESDTRYLRANANSTLSNVLKITGANSGLIYEKSTAGGYVPVLAQYITSSSSHTGAIKIAFPTDGTADMICGWVDIFDYGATESISVFIGGYLYQSDGANEWVNESAIVYTTNANRNFTVRFGHDGTNNCIYIGELNTAWSYPQITCRDWTIGYTADIDAYATGTTISFEATAFQNVDATLTNNNPIASDADTLDGLQSSSFLRSDANDTTTGSLTVNGDLITNTIRDRTGSQLILLAGEATADASQTSEKVFVNAEGGFEVAASPDNWATGYAGTRKTLINYNGITYNGNTVWHQGNDGSGSGLDADLLDGQHGSYYLDYNNFTNTPTIPTDTNFYLDGITKSGNTLTFSVNGATNQQYTFGSNAFTSTTIPTNNNQLTNGAGYITAVPATESPLKATELSSSVNLDNLNSAQAGFYYQTANADTPGNNYPTNEAGSLIVQKSAGNATQLYQTYSTGATLHFRSRYTGSYGSWRRVWSDADFTSTDTNNWDTAYGWGNHASAGYITSADGGNAATLDSLDSTSFARVDAASSYTNYANKQRFYSNSALNTASGNQSNLEVYNGTAGNDAFMTFHVGGDFALYFGLDGGTNKLSVGGWSLGANSYQIWHAGNQGSGSGLDADLLDGIQGSAFLRTDGSTVATGLVRFGGGLSIGSDNDVYLYESSAGAFSVRSGSSGSYNYLTFSAAGALTIGGSTVWHAGNDGSGSGLDADLLDGYHSAENGASVNLRTNGSGYLILDNWLRTGNSTGIYTADGAYFYRLGAYWGSRGSSATVSGTQYQTSDGTTRGYVYSNDSNEIGFLNSAGSWMVRVRSNEIRNYLKVTSDGGFRNSNTTTTATSKTLGFGECCTVTASGLTITLPASPNTGDQVQISVGNFTNTTVGRNSQNIMGLAENLTIDVANMGITLVYSGDATQGWRLI